MPLTIPKLDDRKYQDLLDEALARIPVHNPEWTNFTEADPGVTIVELFAFLTESLLYRSNQIPERNRRKFLSLLGVPLRPASPARGIVTFSNERGALQTLTLNSGIEVRAGQVPFRTELGLDVVPVEGRAYYKRLLRNPPAQLKDYYTQLYTSLRGQPPTKEVTLYETVPFRSEGASGIDLGADAVDNSVWIALLLRPTDRPHDDAMLTAAREAIGGKTISLGIVPSLADTTRRLAPKATSGATTTTLLQFRLPKIAASGGLPLDPSLRIPQYQSIESRSTVDVLSEPGVVQLTLPAAPELNLWNNIDPLESGTGEFPPALDDTTLEARLITWIRVQSSASTGAKLLWLGINAVFVSQRNRVANESLPLGTGEPDQSATLSKTPIVPNSVALTVSVNGTSEKWEEIDDLLCAGSEVPVEDQRQPPATRTALRRPTKVFVIDPESGVIRFGDGLRGARPPYGAVMRADYDYGVGRAGNVGPGSINTSPSLPVGLRVSNPVATWGGSEAETVEEGEKQITRYLRHRDRLVTTEDFAAIAGRAPGVDIGRVEVLAAYNPQLAQNEPGDAPGAVTLLVIPKSDAAHPNAPVPDRLFIDALCDYLEPRRLVTTELFVRGPRYKRIWVSMGINVVAGAGVAEVRERIKSAILRYLSPLPAQSVGASPTETTSTAHLGWPLGRSIVSIELLAEANRVDGVLSINSVLLAEGSGAAATEVTMTGLELPEVAGISVTPGEAVDLDDLRGQGTPPGPPTTGELVSIPAVPEGCL